jgi:anti-sigma regulatory factor (Ser/Thr protein kinase)
MSTVQLRFSAVPSHVRTARLVAAAVARRAGVEESVLDEVRLAVGEACSRAVGLHRRNRPDEPVTVTLIQETGRFSIEVADRIPAAEAPDALGLDPSGLGLDALDKQAAAASGDSGFGGPAAGGMLAGAATLSAGSIPGPSQGRDPMLAEQTDHLTEADDSGEMLSGSMGLAVISGLVDDLDVQAGADGAVIRMSWPARSVQGPPSPD